MILVRDIRLPLSAGEPQAFEKALHLARIPRSKAAHLGVARLSVDARHGQPKLVYTIAVTLKDEGEESAYAGASPCVAIRGKTDLSVQNGTQRLPHRPVVCGLGPAGLFAALVLAMAGLRPIVLERGLDAAQRKAKVEAFWAGGELDPECNVQFGEGGAGTFSDGKLNTGTKNERIGWVLEQFAEAGAGAEILFDAKPHIGTDVLVTVVQNLREKILHYGGEVRFGTRLTGLRMENGRLAAVRAVQNGEETELPCTQLLLAIGHSARDTFEMLHAAGIPMEPKPFSMGVRIEHRQKDINAAQYGAAAERLPAADYSLSCHLPDGSSAYTFCMCPGGEVFAAASEAGGVCTNGMSNSRRDGENANAAVLVTLRPEDFPDKRTLGGMYWQRSIEQRAYVCGGSNYHAPAQLAGDFLAGHASTGPGHVQPTYRPGVTWCDLHDVLPKRITDTLAQALPAFGKKLRGFDDPDAVLTAPETRSSSPVRIVRGPDRCSTGVPGLYPCGEGAGYAGGITSAAVDGLRCAESVIAALQNEA